MTRFCYNPGNPKKEPVPDDDKSDIPGLTSRDLELLEFRLKEKVRQDFLKAVAIPVGGGGVAAIALALFVWIPSQVREMFEGKRVQDQIQSSVQASTQKYLDDPSTKTQIDKAIELQTKKALATEVPMQVAKNVTVTVTNFFASTEGHALVSTNVTGAVKGQFDLREMQDRLRQLVTEYLKGDGQKVIADAINKELKPISEAMGKSVFLNKDKLVSQLEQQSLRGEPKLSYDHLQQFLKPDNVKTIKKQGLPIILTKEVRAGFRYDLGVIEDYLKGFRDAFGPQFKYVGIFYGAEQQLAALIDSKVFQAKIRSDAGPAILKLLNSEEKQSRKEVEAGLSALFGPQATKRVKAEETVVQVLRNPLYWPDPQKLDASVPVVDSKDRLFATTSREQLIKGLMSF